jgi:NAD(P)-dependent dehydrogenase (short-subunit alcohol dehydrogenase family)
VERPPSACTALKGPLSGILFEALDLKGTGIRVNVLSPGAKTTPGLLNRLAKTGMLVLQAGLCLLSRGVGGKANFYQPLRSIKLGPKDDFVRSDIQGTNLFGTVLLVF